MAAGRLSVRRTVVPLVRLVKVDPRDRLDLVVREASAKVGRPSISRKIDLETCEHAHVDKPCGKPRFLLVTLAGGLINTQLRCFTFKNHSDEGVDVGLASAYIPTQRTP